MLSAAITAGPELDFKEDDRRLDPQAAKILQRIVDQDDLSLDEAMAVTGLRYCYWNPD
jgi:hypothetical protein